MRALEVLGTRPAPARPEAPSRARRVKRDVSRAVTTRLVNPLVLAALERIPRRTGWAILETTGRQSGLPRRVPGGDGLRGDRFWIVTEHGWSAHYVRNILRDPRVRINVAGRWRAGTAHVLPGD